MIQNKIKTGNKVVFSTNKTGMILPIQKRDCCREKLDMTTIALSVIMYRD
jgi:hypothetical protein